MTCPDCGNTNLGPHAVWVDGGGFVTGYLRCPDCGRVIDPAAEVLDRIEDPIGDLLAGAVPDVEKRIADCVDVDLLRAAAEQDERKGVKAAVAARVEELTAKPDSDLTSVPLPEETPQGS